MSSDENGFKNIINKSISITEDGRIECATFHCSSDETPPTLEESLRRVDAFLSRYLPPDADRSWEELKDESKPLDRTLVEEIKELVKGVEVDLDEPLQD